MDMCHTTIYNHLINPYVSMSIIHLLSTNVIVSNLQNKCPDEIKYNTTPIFERINYWLIGCGFIVKTLEHLFSCKRSLNMKNIK